MARTITSRLVLEGRLVAESPVHVGGTRTLGVVDLAPAVDGTGDYYLPGTSIAGVLRSWLASESEHGDELVNEWWGALISKETSAAAQASFVSVDDAPVTLPPGASAEVRDGVGIDRLWGSAAEHIKFDRAVLPVGSTAPLRVAIDCATPDSEAMARAMIASLKRGLESGALRFGAATTRGLGRMRLMHAGVERLVLSTRSGMLAALKRETETVDLDDDEGLVMTGRPRISITIDWEADGPLMVASGDQGLAVDHLPLVSAREGGVALTVPGSSIKGALRSQAERIVRTLTGARATAAVGSTGFLDQLEMPLISSLFGSTGDDVAADSASHAEGDPLPGRGALGVSDCFAQPLERAAWERLQGSDDMEETFSALAAAGLPEAQVAFHVAVDRWTGSAADGLLFDTLEPFGVAWDPIRMDIDLGRIPPAERRPALALIVLLLRDLVDGRIPLGFGVNRGMGGVRVTALGFQAWNLGALLSAPAQWHVELPTWSWPSGLLEELEPAWQAWCKGGETQ